MFVEIRYPDGEVEALLAGLQPEQVERGGELVPGWKVAEPKRCGLKSDFFETALNVANQRGGKMEAAEGETRFEPFEWRFMSNEKEHSRTLLSIWVSKFSRFDPAGTPEGLAAMEAEDVDRFRRNQKCWMHFLEDPLADIDQIISDKEEYRASRERMDALSPIESRYLHGWCAQFATALHMMTGWTMYGIHGPDEYGEAPRHVICRMPDGTFADVRGLGQSAAQICEGYTKELDEHTLRPVSRFEMVSRFRREEGALERAQEDVRSVLGSALEQTSPIIAIDVTFDGSRCRMTDRGGGELLLSDLDLSEMMDYLARVPEISGLALDDEGLRFDIRLAPDSGATRLDVAVGWIESMLVAVAEGAPMPRSGLVHITLPDARAVERYVSWRR